MSTRNYEISHISKRILALSEEYPTAKAFLEKCEISNYSLITDIKKGRMKTPGAEYLEQIVRGTGCSGTWLLTGEGEKFEPRNNMGMGSDAGINYSVLAQTLEAIERIEQTPNAIKELPLPPDFEVQVAEFLAKLLRHRLNS